MRKSILKKVSISIVAVLVMTIMAPLITSADYNANTFTPSSININVKDADVRDVLSAIAKNMGYSIIYKGSSTTITIKLEDMAPETAFDYILKNIGVTYLKDGDVLIVASRDVLTKDYARSLYLTKFDLTYIDAGTLNSKISQLGIPVTVISMETNQTSLWVQGFPSDVTKVRELINVLDISENSTIGVNGESGDSVSSTKTLSFIKLNFIKAHTFNRFLKTLGVNVGMVLSPDPQVLHLYATPEERQQVASLCAQVDNFGSFADVNNANMFEYRAPNVPKSVATSTLQSACPDVEIVTVDNASKGFFLKGDLEAIRLADEVLAQLETNVGANKPATSFFAHTFTNITAAEAVKRLSNIKFDEDVNYYPSDYSDFSKTIYVYCNNDYESTMKDVLKAIDSVSGDNKMDTYNAPIYMAADEAEANIMISYLETMLGNAHASINWKKFHTGAGCVLYIENADVETIQKVEALMDRLKGLKNNYITPGASF